MKKLSDIEQVAIFYSEIEEIYGWSLSSSGVNVANTLMRLAELEPQLRKFLGSNNQTVRAKSAIALSYLFRIIATLKEITFQAAEFDILMNVIASLPPNDSAEVSYELALLGEKRTIPFMIDLLSSDKLLDHSVAEIAEGLESLSLESTSALINALNSRNSYLLQQRVAMILDYWIKTPEARAAVEAWQAQQNHK